MKIRNLTLCLTLSLAAASAAQASSFAGTTGGASSNASSEGTSASSESSSGDKKVVLDAQDDAARFVASEGRIRSARLEAAFARLRQRDAHASDLQLARTILAL